MFPIRIKEEKLRRKRISQSELGFSLKALNPKKAIQKVFKVGKDKTTQQPVARATTNVGGVAYGGSIPVDDAPPKLNISKPQSNSPSTWDKVFSLGSQAIAGFAPNSTIQTVGGQVPIYDPTGGTGGGRASQVQFDSTMQTQNNSVGQGIGSGIDGIFQWAMANPIIPIGAGVMLYLLFKEPPGRR